MPSVHLSGHHEDKVSLRSGIHCFTEGDNITQITSVVGWWPHGIFKHTTLLMCVVGESMHNHWQLQISLL